MLTGTAKNPSRARALPGFHLPSLCILEEKLCLNHLSAGFIWKQDVRDLGHALLEKWRAPWEDYPADLVSLTCSTGTAALPSPPEAFPLKEKTQFFFLDSTGYKTNPSAGKKQRNRVCKFSFADSFCRHLTSIAHLCPARSCCWKFFAIPISVLEEAVSAVWRLWAQAAAWEHKQVHKEVTEPHRQHKAGQNQATASQGPSSYPVPAVTDWPTQTLASSS